MKEIVINDDYGGFSLSRKALLELRKMGNKAALKEVDVGERWKDSNKIRSETFNSFLGSIARDDPDLVKVVKQLGKEANGECASLAIVEIPDYVDCWQIEEYDGSEHIAEKHQTWY